MTQGEALQDFKNTKLKKKMELKNKEEQYKMLLRNLAEVEKQGQEDMERQRQTINAKYAQFLEDFKLSA